MKVRFARLAQRDLVDASAWYDAQRAGLGPRFVAAVDSAITAVSENPHRFPMVHGEARRALVGRFPYGIYFLIVEDYVRVVAVVHLRRGADAWLHRM